jgi:hypothetical protein
LNANGEGRLESTIARWPRCRDFRFAVTIARLFQATVRSIITELEKAGLMLVNGPVAASRN